MNESYIARLERRRELRESVGKIVVRYSLVAMGIVAVAEAPQIVSAVKEHGATAIFNPDRDLDVMDRIPLDGDKCAAIDLGENPPPLLDAVAPFVGTKSEQVGASDKVSTVLVQTQGEEFAVCSNPDYPGSGNKIFNPDSLRGAEVTMVPSTDLYIGS